MKFFHMARLAALSLMVSACAGSTIVTNVYYDKGGPRETFLYVASDRDFLIEIHGNSGGQSQAAFDASVIAAMQDSSFGALTNFTATPSAKASENYRLVVVFSGDRYQGATSICAGVDSASLKPASGRVAVQAAFCYRDDLLSRLDISYAQDPSSLQNAMSQVFINLFPTKDPTIDRCEDEDLIVVRSC